jgi:nitrate/nitrite-specific signal transduction histidine kinase
LTRNVVVPALLILIPVAIGLLLVSLWIYRGLKGNKIRGQLNSGFILMALFPAVAISIGAVAIGYISWRSQVITRLESIAALKETRITAWLQDLQGNLLVALNEEYAVERATVVLSLANTNKYSSIYQKAMRSRFQRFVEQGQLFDEIFLLDIAGRVVVSTDPAGEGMRFADQAFFSRGQAHPHIQLPFDPASGGADGAIVAVPVTDSQGMLLGVLAGRSKLEPLTTILSEHTGLGVSGKAYLVDQDFNVLTANGPDANTSAIAAGTASPVRTAGASAVTQTKSNGVDTYDDSSGRRVIGVYRWLSAVETGLLVEQDEAEALQSITTTLGVNFGIIVLSVLLAVGASWMITRTIASPLVDLVNTAKQIAAGDLDRAVRIGRPDEISALAEAFNSMTTQLRDSISSLEQRVRDRTEALRQRAVQLETSAKVSREITSILEIDDLLSRVVELIRDAFGYYHVNIYLVNDESNQLVLRASNGETVPEMTSLDIDSPSLNSEAARSNQAILLNDVTQDPRYLADPRLPDTRSELVVPMRMGGRVIGTVDVNSNSRDSFTSEDVLVLQSLADQIAIAIENARLYEQSRALAVLEERHRLARELHDAVTQSLFSIDLHAKAIATYAKHSPEQAEKHIHHLRQITHDTLHEMRALIFDLRPVSLEKDGLAQALRQHVNVLQRANNTSIELSVNDERRLPVHVEKQLYRIAQEALGNAIRHAKAQHIDVCLSAGQEQVELSIKDDGCGFEPGELKDERTFGLVGMRERVAAINGSLHILSHRGQGCEVRVRVPA